MALTTPPLEIVSVPGPSDVPPPPAAKQPTFQVEPVPVTVTVGAKTGSQASIPTPPWLLSTPPLLIVTEPSADRRKSVNPLGLTVTVEPAP